MNKKMLILALLGAIGCDEPAETATAPTTTAEVETPEAPEVSPSDILANVLARIGGTQVLAGNMVVEVVPSADGKIMGVVSKENGEPVADAKLTVQVKGEDGSMQDVDLVWDAQEHAYFGTASGTLQTGPVHVNLSVDDNETEGGVPAIAVAPAPLYGGQVVVIGDMAAEMRIDSSGVIQVVSRSGSLDGSANIEVAVPTVDGQVASVPLVWSADTSSYLGSVSADVTFAPGPVVFTVVDQGAPRVTRVAEVGFKAPEHEGQIVVVGDYTVELVPSSGDKVNAWVYDVDGQLVEDADVSFALAASANPVNLTWDASARQYVTILPPSVDVTTAPVRVRVGHHGRVRRGGFAVAAAPAFGRHWRARLDAGAGGAIPPGQARLIVPAVDVRSDARVQASVQRVRIGAPDVRAGIRVRGPGGGVRVQAPNGTVRVQGPNGMVRVQAPGVMVRVQGGANVPAPMGMIAVQAPGANVRVQGGGMSTVRVQLPSAPMVNVQVPMVSAPMVSVMASGMAGGSAQMEERRGGASVMAGASFMAGFGH